MQIGGHRTGPGVQVHMPTASPLNLVPSVPSSGVPALNHLSSKQPQHFPSPLPPRHTQDQPRLTSLPVCILIRSHSFRALMPACKLCTSVCKCNKAIGPTVAMVLLQAPSVVFRKEEISAASSEISAHNEFIGDVSESWDIAAIPFDEGLGPEEQIQC